MTPRFINSSDAFMPDNLASESFWAFNNAYPDSAYRCNPSLSANIMADIQPIEAFVPHETYIPYMDYASPVSSP